jgi:predicted amidohydrolase
MTVVAAQPRTWSPDGEQTITALGRALARSASAAGPRDLVVLPEHVGSELDGPTYANAIRFLARTTGMWIVGGSHRRRQPEPDGGLLRKR